MISQFMENLISHYNTCLENVSNSFWSFFPFFPYFLDACTTCMCFKLGKGCFL